MTAAVQLTRILADYLSDESRVSTVLPFILEAINNNDLLNDENNDDQAVKRKWTVRLNALLGSKQAATRWAAITLIKETCVQSESLFINNVQSWTTQLLGILGKPETTMVTVIAIETQSLLFEKTIGKSELHAEVTLKSLPRFNQLLIQSSRNPELMSVTFTALAKNTELFPSMSRHIVDQTSKLYISCLDNPDQVSPEILGRCFAGSCRTGGKANFSTNWQDNLSRLIGSVHLALNQLFDSVDEEDAVSSRVTGYSLAPVTNDYVDAFPTLLNRIRYLHDTIAVYLATKTMAAVNVPIAQLMTLCCRIYNVYNGCVMKEFKPKDEYTCLMACLPALHLSTNKLLASVLLSADAGMAQYGKLLARILLRLLSENSKKRAVKISVYNLISLCLRKFGYAFADTILKSTVISAISDLKAIESKKVDIVATEKVTGKKRRAEQISSDAFSTTDSVSYQPCDIQLAALEVLQDALSFGNAMDINLRCSIDTVIVSRILQGADAIVKCYLYKCLMSSITSPNINQATLLPHAVRIFGAGLNDETHELRVICTQGLAICDLCMHTRMPPIQRAAPPAPSVVPETVQVEKIVDQSPVRSPVTSQSNAIYAPDDGGEEEKDVIMEFIKTPSPAKTPSPVIEQTQPAISTAVPTVEPDLTIKPATTTEPTLTTEPSRTTEPATFTKVSSEAQFSTPSVSFTETVTKEQTVKPSNRIIFSSDSEDDEFEMPEINTDD
ncbi:rRNA processing/ribosome biogenesis-domain-containing protein [Fennellomyces sp. T-0311]|nr:rRNA processing/ribosome biogenesis-domain-containing protein [Fennellomyces sp. T-0311]